MMRHEPTHHLCLKSLFFTSVSNVTVDAELNAFSDVLDYKPVRKRIILSVAFLGSI